MDSSYLNIFTFLLTTLFYYMILKPPLDYKTVSDGELYKNYISSNYVSLAVYLLLVMIDEPKAIPSKGFYKSDSGWNAVPTAGTIIKRIGPILASKNYNIALNVK